MSHLFCSNCIQAEKTALRLIARAEQCTNGLKRKLEKRRYEAECINEVISRLLDLNLIDDRRFTRLWLESRLRLVRSPKNLLISLCRRGIEQNEAEAAIKEVFNEEVEAKMLCRFVKKYAKKVNRCEDTRTLKYFLKSEGFSSQAIQEFLNE